MKRAVVMKPRSVGVSTVAVEFMMVHGTVPAFLNPKPGRIYTINAVVKCPYCEREVAPKSQCRNCGWRS